MELGPWAECLARLAATPAEATRLFADAITELDRRAADLAAQGKRVWEPAPDMPALVIVVDEYAELPPQAREYADSLARRGRAVAVNLLAATQRPTQEAMGHNAVRSQMDVRICLRVKERRDVDLILGQGSFTSGWHAHSLTQPGTFLISDPEHTAPERARAYLITDDQVTVHAARHARPAAPGSPQAAREAHPGTDDREPAPGTAGGPEGALWEALSHAPAEGMPLWALMAACGMGRSWVYARLREHASAGLAAQVARGSWRAVPPARRGPGDGRPPPRPVTPRRPGKRPRRARRDHPE
jgi:S-DNA-T family DNA segregation ATPase FtsK/SpoIIIE